MTFSPHLARCASYPSHLASVTSALHTDNNRKKEFPSVVKLLDDLNFHDETHPDFLLRSSRFKSKSTPLAHRSPFVERSSTCVHSSYKAKPASFVTRLNRLEATIHSSQLSIHSCRPDPAIPILLKSASESSPKTIFSAPSPTGSELSSASSTVTSTESRKRSYACEDDDEHDLSESEESPDSALAVRINWKSDLNQNQTAYDRVIARPSRTWLERTVEESTGGCSIEGNETGDGLVGLVVPRTFDIHQGDKRRRYVHSPRFHEVIR